MFATLSNSLFFSLSMNNKIVFSTLILRKITSRSTLYSLRENEKKISILFVYTIYNEI